MLNCAQRAVLYPLSPLYDLEHKKISKDFEISFSSKVKGAENLHSCCKTEVDFFVMCSSVAASVGSPGQANYASANSKLDQMAKENKNYFSIQFGAIEGTFNICL